MGKSPELPVGKGGMMDSLLFRVSVILGFLGAVLGLYMGISQNFVLVPAHAHLNLLGFVTLFLAALYYRTVPAAAALTLAKVHTAVAVTGALLFPIGIACVLLGGRERFEPVVAGGAVIVISSMAMFAVVVFRTSGARRPATAADRATPRELGQVLK
jgi:hypothetical protein